jgi:hypothetical protein
VPCPRCQKPLVDAQRLGWCQSCGYCRTLDEDRARLALEPGAEAAPAPMTPPGSEPFRFPTWAIGLLVGVFLLIAGTWAINHFVTLKPLHRAMWTSLQMLAGVMIMMIGQSYALMRIAPEEATLYFTDAVVPFRLYGMVFKRLPRLCLPVFLGSWGLTITLAALICVGGLGHWLTYLPKARDAQAQRR